MNRIITAVFLAGLMACASPQPQPTVPDMLADGTPNPVPIKVPQPTFPRAAMVLNQQGWVLLKFDVDHNGRTKNIVVVDSYPGDMFDRSASEAAVNLLYSPPMRDGHNVALEGVHYKYSYQIERR